MGLHEWMTQGEVCVGGAQIQSAPIWTQTRPARAANHLGLSAPLKIRGWSSTNDTEAKNFLNQTMEFWRPIHVYSMAYIVFGMTFLQTTQDTAHCPAVHTTCCYLPMCLRCPLCARGTCHALFLLFFFFFYFALGQELIALYERHKKSYASNPHGKLEIWWIVFHSLRLRFLLLLSSDIFFFHFLPPLVEFIVGSVHVHWPWAICAPLLWPRLSCYRISWCWRATNQSELSSLLCARMFLIWEMRAWSCVLWGLG